LFLGSKNNMPSRQKTRSFKTSCYTQSGEHDKEGTKILFSCSKCRKIFNWLLESQHPSDVPRLVNIKSNIFTFIVIKTLILNTIKCIVEYW
jgi:two-component SAPR family response regulator